MRINSESDYWKKYVSSVVFSTEDAFEYIKISVQSIIGILFLNLIRGSKQKVVEFLMNPVSIYLGICR